MDHSRKEEDLLGGCCINQVRDDSGLDKGNSNGVGSEETVFTDRVDVRCGSERVLRTTPSILAWASGRLEFSSIEMGKSASGASLK